MVFIWGDRGYLAIRFEYKTTYERCYWDISKTVLDVFERNRTSDIVVLVDNKKNKHNAHLNHVIKVKEHQRKERLTPLLNQEENMKLKNLE